MTSLTAGGIGVFTPTSALSLIFAARSAGCEMGRLRCRRQMPLKYFPNPGEARRQIFYFFTQSLPLLPSAQVSCCRMTSLTAGGIGVFTPTSALSLIFAARSAGCEMGRLRCRRQMPLKYFPNPGEARRQIFYFFTQSLPLLPSAQVLCCRTTSLPAGGVGVFTPTYALSLIFAAYGGDKRSAA